jgi:hypothetical protein
MARRFDFSRGALVIDEEFPEEHPQRRAALARRAADDGDNAR